MADYRFPGEWMEDGMVLEPNVKPETLNELRNFVMTEDHVLIAAYPKTGITWTQELVWLICNNGDTEEARSTIVYDRVPYLEYNTDGPLKGLDKVRKLTPPYIMKTHLRPDIFHRQIEKGKLKVIIVMRNPKDTLVSFYHFYRMHSGLGKYRASWHEFFELYKAKHLLYGDYFEWYSKWLQYKNKPNVMLVKYEDMHRRLADVTNELSKFLDKYLPEKVIPAVFRHLAFENMRDNDMVNYSPCSMLDLSISLFIRKGKIGDWKNYFSEEESALVDVAYRETFEGFGVRLEFE